ncbi:MAG: hypothetical protein WCG27_12825, partial [Pseudomonadota bacterium]
MSLLCPGDFFLRAESKATVEALKAKAESFDKRERYFNQAQEYPNLFLPREYRNIPFEKIPPKVITDSKKLVNQAMNSIFMRMTTAIYDPQQGKVKLVHLLPECQKMAKGIDSQAKVGPSGGLVRSVFGYLYQEVKAGIRQGKTMEETLQRIAQERVDIPA